MTEQTILDMCCGSPMFWLGKEEERVLFFETILNYIVSA